MKNLKYLTKHIFIYDNVKIFCFPFDLLLIVIQIKHFLLQNSNLCLRNSKKTTSQPLILKFNKPLHKGSKRSHYVTIKNHSSLTTLIQTELSVILIVYSKIIIFIKTTLTDISLCFGFLFNSMSTIYCHNGPQQ